MVKVTTPLVDPAAPMLRKKELVERVVAASGCKKRDVKPVVEAMLGVLGAALSAGEVLNLQPLGKVTVKRQKDLDGAELLVARIRRNLENAPNSPLAEPAEEG